jgi:signal transduction histidine kinase
VATASLSPLVSKRPAEPTVRTTTAIALGGTAAAALTAWAVGRSRIFLDPTERAFWDSTLVVAWVATGAYLWRRRPASRIGPLVIAFGFLSTGYALSASARPVSHTLGLLLWAATAVCRAYVYLAFPSGRLSSRLERRFVAGFALMMAVLWGLTLAIAPRLSLAGAEIACRTRCPPNALQIAGGGVATVSAMEVVLRIVLTIAAVGVAALVFNKARSSSPGRRRTTTPLAVVLIAGVIEFVAAMYLLRSYPGTSQTLLVAYYLLSLAVPIAFLIGLARGEAFAGTMFGRVALRAETQPTTPESVQLLVGDTLGDPSVVLALWDPERAGYADVHGAPIELPREGAERVASVLTRAGRPLAALIYGASLDVDPDVVDGLTATSLTLLENAELIAELRESRARIATAAQHERLNVEHDLHDGAQQRLMAIQLKLAIAQRCCTPDTEQAQRLTQIRMDAAEAIDELRALAHGLYPSALRDGGLAAGMRSLAISAAIPVTVDDEGVGRWPDAVEGAVYFCSCEAVQNATKHAGSRAHVRITVGRRAGAVEFEVADDGVGMDAHRLRDGVGLVSMRDRIGAVGGELEVISSPGQGTIVRGNVPSRPRDEALVHGTPGPAPKRAVDETGRFTHASRASESRADAGLAAGAPGGRA